MSLTCTLRVYRFRKCLSSEMLEVELVRTCNCTILIDGRQVSTLRTVPYSLDLLGIGHTIVSGYKPESVHVFQASETDYVVNTLTLGKLELPPRRVTMTKLTCRLIAKLYKQYSSNEADRALYRAVAISAKGDYVCDVEDIHSISLVYRLIGALYALKRTLQEIVVFLTCNVDESILQALSVLQLIGVITSGKVTYDAVVYARKNNMLLVGDYDPTDNSFTLYSGEVVNEDLLQQAP